VELCREVEAHPDKQAMGATHFLTKRFMKRAIKVLGAEKIIDALQPA